MLKGKFVTLEGCEGVGKSTQLRLIKEYCIQNGVDAVFTREPGGTPIAEQIRNVILSTQNGAMDDMTELLLYVAARRQHLKELIEPSVNAGKIVFCDRFCDSTLAYQGYARGISIQTINSLNNFILDGFKIDLTVFIDVSPAEGFLRKGGASESDRLEQENGEFFKKVYSGFCSIASDNPDRVIKIKADGSKLDTHSKIIKVLREKGIL